ncbi:MAG: c-type cytochrome [Deltaproteobacteria bacterium]
MSDDNKDYDGIKYRAETSSPMIFKLLLAVLVIWGVCFMGYYLFSGWSSEGEFSQKKKAKQEQVAANKPAAPAAGKEGSHPEEAAAAGKKTYADRCASCHGADGKGGIGPDLTREKFNFGKGKPDLLKSIAEGRPGGMPGFKSDLSHDQIEGVIAHILSLK